MMTHEEEVAAALAFVAQRHGRLISQGRGYWRLWWSPLPDEHYDDAAITTGELITLVRRVVRSEGDDVCATLATLLPAASASHSR